MPEQWYTMLVFAHLDELPPDAAIYLGVLIRRLSRQHRPRKHSRSFRFQLNRELSRELNRSNLRRGLRRELRQAPRTQRPSKFSIPPRPAASRDLGEPSGKRRGSTKFRQRPTELSTELWSEFAPTHVVPCLHPAASRDLGDPSGTPVGILPSAVLEKACTLIAATSTATRRGRCPSHGRRSGLCRELSRMPQTQRSTKLIPMRPD